MIPPEANGLRSFQERFSNALMTDDCEPGHAADLAAIVSQPGFSVYRNTVMKACIDALQANYPAVSRLVGGEWFRAAAAIFARANLPRHPTLLEYGEGFAAFIADFGPAAQLPYLASIARLDRAWTEAHVAPNHAPVQAAAIAGLDPIQLGQAVLEPHPSARWACFDEPSVASIWRRNRDPDAPSGAHALAAQGVGVLFVRPDDTVQTLDIDAAGCAFLDACLRGHPLGVAAAASLEVDTRTDLSGLMARLLSAGAFGSLMLPDTTPLEK